MFRTLLSSVLLVAISFLFMGVPAARAMGPVEVALTVPLETELGIPGVRPTQLVWLEMINQARQTIDLEQFYITSKPGEALDPVLNALAAAAARGVRVRFVIDSKFFQTYPGDATRLNSLNNVEVRTVDFSSVGGIQHSKYFIVDGTQLFEGSANFDWAALSHIHEVGLRLADAGIAASLEAVFTTDWNHSDPLPGARNKGTPDTVAPFPPGAAQPGVQLFASPPQRNPQGVNDTLTGLVNLLGSAQRTIRVQVYQFTTKSYGDVNAQARWTVLFDALRGAATRGVKVHLLVDAVSLKSGGNDLRALAGVANIEVKTVSLPQWSGGPIPYARVVHSKYVVVDDVTSWVGTENWSREYFTGSRNVGLIVQAPEVAGPLAAIYDRLWTSPYANQLPL